ncbi:DUF3592 domain-containing protein [candidate division KSB1 bacterium]|nr:DUF3592 domain-containing protein [candidate division KSB1 bacterium]
MVLAKVRIKNKRKYFSSALLFFGLFLWLLMSNFKDIYLAYQLSKRGETVEGVVSKTWTTRARGSRSYHVKYEFAYKNVVYTGQHDALESVMVQARETRVVKVYFLPNNPKVNAPLFWGESVKKYASRSILFIPFCIFWCYIFATQIRLTSKYPEVRQIWRYKITDILFGLFILLFLGFCIYDLTTWSEIRLVDIESIGGGVGKKILRFIAVGFLLFLAVRMWKAILKQKENR